MHAAVIGEHPVFCFEKSLENLSRIQVNASLSIGQDFEDQSVFLQNNKTLLVKEN